MPRTADTHLVLFDSRSGVGLGLGLELELLLSEFESGDDEDLQVIARSLA